VYATLGYAIGEYSPGHRRDLRGMYRASHHLMLAHTRAASVLRALVPGCRVGIAHHLRWIDPADPSSSRDRATSDFMDTALSRFYMDPYFHGAYPEEIVRRSRRWLPRGFESDLAGAKGTLDFVGVNYYARDRYRWAPLQPYVHAKEYLDPAAPRNPIQWEIFPAGLHRHLARLRDEYGNPEVVVTENGFPTLEEPGRDPLDDPDRIAYLRDHVAVVGRAIVDGCRCTGYFHWSFTDNFEWTQGYAVRFGLLRVDYATQERLWRRSACWYRDLARTNAIELDDPPRVDA